jgi:Tol biopolymer transport system component
LSYFNQLSWAPDNSRLATTGIDLKGRRGAFVIDAATGEAVLVVEGTNPYPKWSADGERIFYRKSNGGPIDLLIVERHLSSGAERTIATGELGNFSVSPDGQWVAVASGGVLTAAAEAILLVNIATGETRDLFRAAPGDRLAVWTGLLWTADSSAVIVRKAAPAQELWLVPISGSVSRKIEADVTAWALGPFGAISLHPDGRQLAGTRVTDDGAGEVRVLENFLPSVK